MARRLLVLLLPLALLAGACSSDDAPAPGSTTTTTSSSSSSSTSAGGSTTTPAGPEIAMTGDAGHGSMSYSLATDRSEFCYRITVDDAGKPTEAHVRRGKAGSTGEVVLNLTPPGKDGTVNTCSATDTLLIDEIKTDPGAFYVEVHTPEGALRAQLR